MTPEEVLAKAADLIEERGWLQGDLVSKTGELCMSGATLVACGWETSEDVMGFVCPSEWHFAVRAICKEITDPTTLCIPDWNDEPGRTKEEVVTTLRNSKRHLTPTQENV